MTANYYWVLANQQRSEINSLHRTNQDHIRKIEALQKENEAQKSTIDQWMKSDEQKLKTINEQNAQIKKLEKRIAQMKGSKKIQEEILALKAKRVDAEKKNEEEIAALKAKHAETGIETDKELQERERELDMAEDIKDEVY
ncbi:hypothetical protein KCU93_g6880, partial [Aureobasidium melanogenum]